jgi:hypothetical protein
MGTRFNSLEELMRAGASLTNSVTEWAESGFQICKAEELDNRLSICNSCEFMFENRCLKCGCFLQAKARLATSRCPEGKWQSLTLPPSV